MIEKSIRAVGEFHCGQKNRYDTPRQGVLQAGQEVGVVQLFNHENFSQALIGIEGFSRIWLIFGFHLNQNYKLMVKPPAHSKKKVGIFATRSPHRPNGLGLSCVKLEKVENSKLQLHVSEFDLLHESPIYDIKPYIPYADAFLDAEVGWLDQEEELFTVGFGQLVQEQLTWLEKNNGPELLEFAKRQLCREPTSKKRKRVQKISDTGFVLAYRTWRLAYQVEEEKMVVTLTYITSGYSDQDLAAHEDAYQDKELHRRYKKAFKSNT